jgi:hypothetical protein
MKTYRGSGCIEPRILDLSTTSRWVVSFTPLSLYPRGKSLRYPLDKRLGGHKTRSGRPKEEQILNPTATRTGYAIPAEMKYWNNICNRLDSKKAQISERIHHIFVIYVCLLKCLCLRYPDIQRTWNIYPRNNLELCVSIRDFPWLSNWQPYYLHYKY